MESTARFGAIYNLPPQKESNIMEFARSFAKAFQTVPAMYISIREAENTEENKKLYGIFRSGKTHGRKEGTGRLNMSKKRIATIVVLVVTVAALGGAAIYGLMEAERYKRDLQYGYKRSLTDLGDSIGSIRTTLDKAAYANTATEQNGLAAKLMRESSMAKSALAVLPLSDNSLDNVSKFITQVGDFSMALSRKISAGGKISAAEYKTIQELEKYSSTLNTDLENANPDPDAAAFTASFKDTADDFTDFPSLIYDGPFSDHIGQRKPKLTQGKQQIQQGNAQTAAAEFLNRKESGLTHVQDTAGNLPAYNFTADDGAIRISVTKAGSYISEMNNTREVRSQTIGYAEASKKARSFLDARGIKNMKESYYVINDNICLINYAYLQGNVVCYPDLVKVGIALDNGEVVRFQTAGYIMNHTERSLTADLTAAEAQKSVSPNLTVRLHRLALIPTPGLNEVLTYEFQCTGKQGENVLVYINASTGYEEDILILQKSDNGVLAQ